MRLKYHITAISSLLTCAAWAKDKGSNDQDVSNFTGIIALAAGLYIVATHFVRSYEDRLVIGFWWLLTIGYMYNKADGFDAGMLIGPFAITSLYADQSYGLLMLAFAIFIQLIPMIMSARIGLGYVRSSSTDIEKMIAGVATIALVFFWFYLLYSLYPTLGDYMHDKWYAKVH